MSTKLIPVLLVTMLLMTAGACRDVDDEEEAPAFYTFILDTPPDGASDVDPRVLLHWSIWKDMKGVDDADLYFGDAPDPPFLKKVARQDSGHFRPGPLKQNRTYYWRLAVPAPPGASKVQSFSVGRDRTVWAFQLPPGQSYYDVNGTPRVLGSRVYQESEGGKFHCLDAASGNWLWTFDANQGGSPAGMPPAAVEKIYYNSRKIYCLDAATGALLWSAAPANPNLGFRDPQARGDRVFTYTNERISCLDAASGAEVWGTDRAVCTSLAAENDRVFVTSRDAGEANYLECLDAATGAVLWNKNFGTQSSPSHAAVNIRHVFVGHGGRLYCLDARDGTAIWEYQAVEYAANPFAFDGKVLLATGQDRYALLDAANGIELWQTGLQKTAYQHYTSSNGEPVLVNGSLVLADMSGYVYSLDMMDGRILWKYFVSTDMLGAACFGKRIYVTGDDESLYCLNAE